MEITIILIAFLCLHPTNAWLYNFWGRSEESSAIEDSENLSDSDYEYEYEEDEERNEIRGQLESARCPARANLELRDYWRCLWATSLTAEGRQQHMEFVLEDHLAEQEEEARKLQEEVRNRKQNKRKKPKRGAPKGGYRTRRRKRQTGGDEGEGEGGLEETVGNVWEVKRAFNYLRDIDWASRRRNISLLCMQAAVKPGLSLWAFMECLRKNSPRNFSLTDHGTYLPGTYPPLNNTYDKREFIILNDTDVNLGWGRDFTFHFDPLKEEESFDNFGGADPYLGEQLSRFRYKYDNLNSNQRQPGWSYTGSDSPQKWNQLDIKKFYIPVLSAVDLKKMETLADIAQTYPGVGELVESKWNEKFTVNISAPLDYRWNKDSGYHAYSRFPLSLIDHQDLDYFKYKKIIDDSLEIQSDKSLINDIIRMLVQYRSVSGKAIKINETKEDDIPFVDVYREFLQHYFHLDPQKYKLVNNRTDLKREYYIMRRVLRGYVEAVHRQERCVSLMVEQYEYRRDATDQEDLLKDVLERCKNRKPTKSENGKLPDPATLYTIRNETVYQLYDWYFDRKEARERYSLPEYPNQFPVCQHSEPSPINIITTKGRKSSLTTYVFGQSAYTLNKFFLAFPIDGSNLLSLGVVRGERMDDSAVRLTGGAVKGQNLTFQTMHIRFAEHWKQIGSEHHLDGQGAAMELQMVFTISGTADSIKYWHILARVQNQLFQFREKLVIVLAVLVDVLETDADVMEKVQETNQDPFLFEPLAQAAYHFRKQRESRPDLPEPRGYVSSDPVFRFIDFIPQTESKFFTYRGSLSWPPCFGYVLWSVYQQRLYMSKRQFDQFALIPAIGVSDDNLAGNNFRRFQDIFVEAETDPDIDYPKKLSMIQRRTVDRFILSGIHQPKEGDKTTLVDPSFYYVNIVDAPSSTKCNRPSGIHVVALHSGACIALALLIIRG